MGDQHMRAEGAEMGEMLQRAAAVCDQRALDGDEVFVDMGLEYRSRLTCHPGNVGQHMVAGRLRNGNGERGMNERVALECGQVPGRIFEDRRAFGDDGGSAEVVADQAYDAAQAGLPRRPYQRIDMAG